MTLELLWYIALGSAGFTAVMLFIRVRRLLDRPQKPDLTRGKGDPGSGAVYALTLGMSPTAKESTRQHFLSYLRGILFHLGIFASILALLLGSSVAALGPFVQAALAYTCLLGFLCGLGGLVERTLNEKMKVLSTPDDWFSALLVTAFCGLGGLALLQPGAAAFFYLEASLVFIYLPFSKIVHAVYFFFSRYYFGRHFGHRGVLGTRLPAEDFGRPGEKKSSESISGYARSGKTPAA